MCNPIPVLYYILVHFHRFYLCGQIHRIRLLLYNLESKDRFYNF
ncbi:070R [Invertebrate iridescent virus Kaz2018]|uniref:070R n=1 Tax=Invertebrate iridescent virus 6 TaxID=176652 RepID=Q91G37_IIV6|nr:070R [Invertebrate iridescent virus 6]AAK81995.1 070R [Invertebrate iridescent virus 6]QNH08482.1 070R [Invertebrate iridescent virus Kaz2018]